MKKLFAILLCLLLLLSSCAFAETGDVYDRAITDGQMSARFLANDTTNGERSGDSTILISPDGKVMVIDADEPTCAPMIVAALEKLGIEKIDYLVASHPHIDHVGGMATLIEHFEIGQVYTGPVEYPTATNLGFLAAVEAAGLKRTILSKGDSFMFGEFVRVDVLWPYLEVEYPPRYPDGSTQFVNNLSLVMKMTYNDSSYLFAGDLYTIGERLVIEDAGAEALKADVLKMNHHGAETSSSRSWRQAVSPKVAVAMCNLIQSVTVCQKFAREGVDVRHVYLDGTVLVATKGDGAYTVLCEKQRLNDF